MNPRIRTEERHTSHLVVQINGYFSWFGGEGQTGRWQGVGRVLISTPQAEGPETIWWTYSKFPFSVNRVPGHAEVPVRLVSYFHFPVVSTWDKGFLRHHIGDSVESFGIFWNLLLLAGVSDLLPVIWEGEAGVSCARVQCELHCKKETPSALQHVHQTNTLIIGDDYQTQTYLCISAACSALWNQTQYIQVIFNPYANNPVFIFPF